MCLLCVVMLGKGDFFVIASRLGAGAIRKRFSLRRGGRGVVVWDFFFGFS